MCANPVALAAMLFVLVALPRSVWAYDGSLGLGVHLGYGASFDSELESAHGLGLGIDANLGLNDTWSLLGHASFMLHPANQQVGRMLGGAELVYMLDVLSWVPFFGAGAFAQLDMASGQSDSNVGVNGIVGLDYFVSRELLMGLDIRPFLNLSNFNTDPAYLTVNLRLTWLLEL
ncbi:MAG: hypothetical protein IPJ88_11850 [Myxococcales bacterium]|nr:MAG: hypothetical protein IPJ88_11850 [Myxococcales bacterium]